MKKFISRLFLLSPLLILIVLFNFIVDPARLFQNKDYEKKIVEALNAGHIVTNLVNSNFDDRTMEKLLIGSLKGKKDIAVFGSSQVMQISSETFPGRTFINNALTSSTLEDYISLYEIYREKGILPSTIIIGVNPWDFNRNNNRVKWRQFGPYYSQFMKEHSKGQFNLRIRPQDIFSYEFQQLVSVSYFQAGLEFLRNSFFYLKANQQWFTLTDQRWNAKQTILPDGSQTHPGNVREATPDEVRKHVDLQNANNDALYMLGYYELDNNLKNNFISLIQAMKDDGVRVVLFLPPYNPRAYDFYIHSERFKVIKDVEIFLRKTAADYDLTLVGSYNAHLLNIPESEFFDTIHLRDDAPLKRIFNDEKSLNYYAI